MPTIRRFVFAFVLVLIGTVIIHWLDPFKTDFLPKDHRSHHLLGNVHLFAFGDRNADELCISISSAILAGWRYHLIQRSPFSFRRKGIFRHKYKKMEAYTKLVQSLPSADVLILADSFDVIYQGSATTLIGNIAKNEVIQNILFNAEVNCFPYTGLDAFTCPLMQGNEYLQNRNFSYDLPPEKALDVTACRLQYQLAQEHVQVMKRCDDKRYTVGKFTAYLNSGLAIGIVENFKHLFRQSKHYADNLDKACLDDQGIIGWLYVKRLAPITLDFNASVVATTLGQLPYYRFNETLGVWENEFTSTAPYFLHFNGDKMDYRAMQSRILQWHISTFGFNSTIIKIWETLVDVDGKLVPYQSICNLQFQKFLKLLS